VLGEGGASSGKSRKKMWIAIGVIGVAAAIAGGIAASGGDSADAVTGKRPVVIAPGTVTVGGPR
jgi:hypothetical protein